MRHFDNDMDELFNKAGKEYPLNTGKKDWNAVQKALATEEEAPAKAAATKNFKRFYPLLILLLLLPVLFYVIDNNAERIKEDKKVNSEKYLSAENANKTSGNNISRNDISKKDISTNNIDENEIAENKISENNISQNNDSKNTHSENSSPKNNNAEKKIPGNNLLENDISHNNISKNNTSIQNITNQDISQERNLERSLFPFRLYNGNFTHPYASIAEPQVKNTEPASAPQSAKKKPTKLYPSLYYGVMAGPDFSTIKYQDIKNIGSGLGLLLGYRFSQHWSVEAAGYWSTKKYYTDGKYFDKANANVPAYVELYFLDGGCQMIEVPIDVRYEFTPGRNTFFMTAGLNSYFMKKESYDYKADASGSVYDGHRNYKNSGSNLFSNLQISGGYQHKLFSKFIVRIEPYLQVPLREVGIGKMPITSAGVHFGLVRETK